VGWYGRSYGPWASVGMLVYVQANIQVTMTRVAGGSVPQNVEVRMEAPLRAR